MNKINLTKEESLELENLNLKMSITRERFQIASAAYNGKVEEVCKKYKKDIKDAVNIDFDKGTIELREEDKKKEK